MTQTDPFATKNDSKPADPFGQADGSAPAGDPFGNAPRPESSFINSSELKPNGIKQIPGALVLIRCDNAEIINEADPFHKPKPGEKQKMRDKLIADTAVLDGEHAGRSQEGMWWFWGAIAGSVKRAQKAGTRCILGRVSEVPSTIEKAKPNGAQDVDDLPGAYAEFRAGDRDEKPNVAIILADFTEDDAVKAREFLAAHPEFLK